MKRTLIAVALAACAGTQLFAQNVKEGVITFALKQERQNSVSTSPTKANAGNWSQRPMHYKTAPIAVLDNWRILQSIAYVMHGSPSYYTKPSAVGGAQLVLVQGELGGFFNIVPSLADAETDAVGSYYQGTDNDGTADVTLYTSTISGTYARLATGRHFKEVPAGYATSGAWPVGHHQPWGQIYVKDRARSICENVTFFFSLKVQECYDCFYLNSFITDAKFSYRDSIIQPDGPPCCASQTPSDLSGSGKDKYYLTLTFDNTDNNPYLNSRNDAWIGHIAGPFPGVEGIGKAVIPADGITPDYLPYVDQILSGLGINNPYVMRFTLNGIVTYNWTLRFINTSDLARDFVGTASYAAYGYGFIGLYCSLLSGSAAIAEKVIKVETCCNAYSPGDLPWYDSWYGVGWNNQQDPWSDYFDSPVNVPASLTLHLGYNESYDVRWQWPQTSPEDVPATPDSLVSTKQDGDVHIPSTRWSYLDIQSSK
jgi:hypothetical protein